MITARLAHDVDWENWRSETRRLLKDQIDPSFVQWVISEIDVAATRESVPVSASEMRAPRAFVALSRVLVRHRDADRFTFLHRLASRFSTTPKLLEIASDPDVMRADHMMRSIRRDRHKMTAFLRFRAVAEDEGERFVAWFEPAHRIEEDVAEFFVDRFASMTFTIVTPRRSIDWTAGRLTFGPGGRRADFPDGDGFSQAWNAYYRSTFNPTRVRVSAMLKEMPRKYWANMPETREIAPMLAGAARRTRDYLAASPSAPPPHHRRLLERRSDEHEATSDDAGSIQCCRRCDLWRDTTQAVCGEGRRDAKIMFVGEQPGDREDLLGRPFVGPAGEIFAQALAHAGIDRGEVYLTNAVKHFKHEVRGKRRLHTSPNRGEIEACRWWLDKELDLITAPLIVALGATALFALTRNQEPLSAMRSKAMAFPRDRKLFATVHPAFLLRIPEAARKESEREAFFRDFEEIAKLAA